MDVLVGVCGSEQSFRALEETIDRAREAGDEVTVALLDDPSRGVSLPQIRSRVRSTLSEVEISVQMRDVEENPAAGMVEMAESNGFDQLVIGDCGGTPMGKIHFTDIAQFVLLNANTTVKLVR